MLRYRKNDRRVAEGVDNEERDDECCDESFMHVCAIRDNWAQRPVSTGSKVSEINVPHDPMEFLTPSTMIRLDR